MKTDETCKAILKDDFTRITKIDGMKFIIMLPCGRTIDYIKYDERCEVLLNSLIWNIPSDAFLEYFTPVDSNVKYQIKDDAFSAIFKPGPIWIHDFNKNSILETKAAKEGEAYFLVPIKEENGTEKYSFDDFAVSWAAIEQ